MTVKTLKKNLVKKIDKLSKKELEELNGFIDSFEDVGDEEATKELLAIPGILKRLREAEDAYKNGEYVRWKDLKKNV